jgi:hypothetical protein
VSVASLEPEVPGGVRDIDGRLTEWLRGHDVRAALIRPDFCVFGSVTRPDDLPSLLSDLRTRLHLNTRPLIKER